MAVLTSVLVVGPTGSVGTAVCSGLIARKDLFKRIAAFNNTDRPAGPAKQAALDAFANGGMEIVSGNYSDVSAFKGFDVVMMPLGNFGNFLQPGVIDTAIEAGVRHFYPSEFGADVTVGDNWHQRYYRDKVLTREHLMKRDAELREKGDGLGWSYVCIGRFTEWSIYPRFGWNHIEHTAEIYGTETGRQSVIALEDVAALTVLSLLDPFNPKNSTSRQRTYRFASSSPTWKELFAIMERITGKPYKVTYRPVSEARELEAQAKAENDEELETAASHRLVQGTEGTLLPQPWDNSKFPDAAEKVRGVEEVLKSAWQNEGYGKTYGV